MILGFSVGYFLRKEDSVFILTFLIGNKHSSDTVGLQKKDVSKEVMRISMADFDSAFSQV